MSYTTVPFPGGTSPLMQPAPFTMQPPPASPQVGQIQPGSITYTTTTNQDGSITYHPFRAVAASYQTPQGIVSGIQWVPAEATQVVPQGATPANADFAASFSRQPDWQREDERRRKKEASRTAANWERERREREKAEEKEYRRSQRAEREREREETEEFRRVPRDRDGRDRGDPARRGSTYGNNYPAYGGSTGDLERRFGELEVDRREREYDTERKTSGGYGGGGTRSRRGSVYGDRPTSGYQPAPGGNYPTAPGHAGAPGGQSGYPSPSGGYPSLGGYASSGGQVQRPASPYQSGGIHRPGSPYQAGVAPRPSSPYQAGAGARPASPYHSPRPTSPYHAPRPTSPYYAPRPTSPYRAPRASSPYQAPPSTSPYHAPRPVSPYATGGGIQRASSPYQPGATGPYQSGGTQRPASPYRRAASPLPGAPGVYPPGHVMEGQPIRGNISRAASPSMPGASPYGTAPYPPGSNVYGGSQQYGSSAPYGAADRYGSTDRYGGTAPYGPAATGYPPSGISGRASPRPPAMPGLPGDHASLAPPEGFSRPPNLAQPYTHFDIMKIQDMDDFMDNMPRMPVVLTPHDVYHEDWIRLMTDLSMAWSGKLPVHEYAQDGRPPKRTTLTADLIDLWNSSFFHPRGVELILYKGHERRSGRGVGTVDMHLPGFDAYDDDDDISDSDSEGDSDDDYEEERPRYGAYGGVYGRQAEGQMAELREARRARAQRKAEKKQRKLEQKRRRKYKELEKRYALYLTCISREGGLGQM